MSPKVASMVFIKESILCKVICHCFTKEWKYEDRNFLSTSESLIFSAPLSLWLADQVSFVLKVLVSCFRIETFLAYSLSQSESQKHNKGSKALYYEESNCFLSRYLHLMNLNSITSNFWRAIFVPNKDTYH